MATLSRRSFVASAAVAGVASACGAVAPVAYADEAGDPTAPIAPVAEPAAWDGEYDVIVVGAGGGLFGATHAQELGARTLCVEKLSSVGGASQESSIFAVCNTKVQVEAGFPDISEMVVGSFIAKQNGDAARVDLIRNVWGNSTRTMDWLIDSGCEMEPTTTGGPQGGMTGISPKDAELGGCAERANQGVYTFLAGKFQGLGGELMLSTALTGLVQDVAGAVTGIQVETEEGLTAYYRADKGVLLACGGMAANRDLLAEYVPSAYKRCKTNSSGPQDTGEAILMGLGAGAAFTGFDAYMSFDGGIDGAPWNYYLYSGDQQLARQAWLAFDIRGQRFPYYTEVAKYGAQARLLQNLPGAQCYKIWDCHYDEYASAMYQECCRNLIVPEMPVVDRCVEQDWHIGYERGLELGYIMKADTIEELAEQMCLDDSVVLSAVDEWNALAASGEVDPYGIPTEWIHPIVDAPFYGVKFGSCMFSTFAGLYTNESMHVYSTRGTLIPGLYASGCTMGGCCGPDSSYGMGSNVNGGVCFAATTAFMAVEDILGVLPAYVPPAPAE